MGIEDDGVDVTYRPRPGDPQVTTWRGQEFRAGQAVKIKDASHLSALEANSHFSVDRKDKGGEKQDGDKGKTADTYRREFADRVYGATTVEGLIRAFASERKLREDAGVDAGDIDQLQTHIADRITEMRMREGMGTRQVAELWTRYGMAEGK